MANHSLFGASPFDLGLCHRKTAASVCRFIIKMLEKTDATEARRSWFVHVEPSLLEISCSDMRCVFYKEGRFLVLVVDGLCRLFTTLDRLMYEENGVMENMWRHWMPASFAAAVLSGDDWLTPRFKDMMVGDHLGYNITNCRMVIMPLPMDCRWVTYVWDFLGKILTVLDPYLQHTSVARLKWEHDDTMDCLHQALFDCKDAWFQGWEVDRHNWDYSYPIALGRRCREYNSGVYAMHYALHFDGNDVRDLSIEDGNVLVRGDLLYKMLTMPGNTGELPAFLDDCRRMV